MADYISTPSLCSYPRKDRIINTLNPTTRIERVSRQIDEVIEQMGNFLSEQDMNDAIMDVMKNWVKELNESLAEIMSKV